MSRFIDKLKAIEGNGLQPMGFRSGQGSREKPRLQLVISSQPADLVGLSTLKNADAGIVRVSGAGEFKTLEKLCQGSEIPWGAWFKADALSQTAKTTCDFVVFAVSAKTFAAPENGKPGRILEIESSLGEGLLRTINDLPVDAVLLTDEAGGALTWRNLMQFRRIAGLVGKPLLVTVPPAITPEELQLLWDRGVSGVVVEIAGDEAEKRLSALRADIDKLTSASRRKPKTMALLPHIAPEPETVEEGEEEEDE